jgi:hypothetical protein
LDAALAVRFWKGEGYEVDKKRRWEKKYKQLARNNPITPFYTLSFIETVENV